MTPPLSKTHAAISRLRLSVCHGAGLGLCALFLGVVGCGTGDDTVSTLPLVKDGGADAADATAVTKIHEAGARFDSGVDAEAGSGEAGDADANAGAAMAMFARTPIALWASGGGFAAGVNCGATATYPFTISNSGTAPLAVSATTTGPGTVFSVAPTSVTVAPGASETLTVTASVPSFAAAKTALTGSLNLFTTDSTDPSNVNVSIPLSVTPVGATIVPAQDAPATVHFGSVGVNAPATPIPFSLVNIGNAPANVAIAAPSAGFSLLGLPDGGQATVNPKDNGSIPLTVTFGFTPTGTARTSSTPAVTVTGVTCGANVSAISLDGKGELGTVTGYPTAIDFGNTECGAAAPAPQHFTLTNSGKFDARITTASIDKPGFTTSAASGQIVAANGGTLLLAVTAPPVPTVSSVGVVTATLTLQTDADNSAQKITLTEQPHGAILAFVQSDFGSFGPNVLLQATSHNFDVVNTGNEDATVTATATADGAGAAPFSVSNASFSVAGRNGTQTDSVVYAATATRVQTGTLALNTIATLCAPLPAPVPLSGAGVGGGPTVAPTSLAFPTTCGGAAPPSQTFAVGNAGQTDLTWKMSGLTGSGAANYKVSAIPPPGTLHPGAHATVTVTASAIPSPAPNPDPATYAAQVTISTDVPFDERHVVSFTEPPLGDQLSLSVNQLRFGQFPIGQTTVGQSFTLTNKANQGSPAATVTLTKGGTGSSAYAFSPSVISNLGPSGATSGNVTVTFAPTTASAYPATIALSSSDSLCTPLPAPLVLSGTGTQGKVAVSATTLAFGTDPTDTKGLVNCGATGTPQTFTVSNTGNQAFSITALSLALKTASPYVLSGVTLPALVPIGGSATITVTPNPIPATVADPNDASAYTDTLTVTTDAAQDVTHKIALVMRARGAVIADTPLATSWDFGTLGNGLIGKFATTIKNTGNAPASIAFQGLQHSTVFGLQSSPTTVVPNGVTDVIGQFSPPQANQVWTDHGTLVVTAAQAFCAPLPASWNSPMIALSGSSIAGSLPVTVSGSLAFGSTNCASAAPAAQAITLTNKTNVAYVYTAKLSSGAFYTLQNPSTGDAGAGIIPGSGAVVLGVTPQTVAPGPSVVAGSAPYADDLVISFQSQPPSGLTIPISWTLDGAMLSLPDGLGPNKDASGNGFYVADTQSGFPLSMDNTGTAAATVTFGAQPSNAFTFSPTPPVTVEPNIRALPRLTSVSSDAVCPALTPGSVTFLYSGPVCRPFPFPKVTVQSCVGTF